jgi:hypothetical protein
VADGGGVTDATTDATTGDGGAGDDGPRLIGDSGADAGPPCATTCSADLHQILDCDTPPHVLQTCAGSTGCGPGSAGDAGLQCIDACGAAAANKSSIGCDYYVIPPDCPLLGTEGSCFAAFVNNTWDAPLQVTLEWKGQSIDAVPFSYIPTGSGTKLTYTPVPSTGIPSHQLAIVFLNQYNPTVCPLNPGCYSAAYCCNQIPCPAGVHAAIETEDVGLHGTGIGSALHLTTTLPASVDDIYPYGGAKSQLASATMLLPTSIWDTNYVAVTSYPAVTTSITGTLTSPPEVEIVGMTDGTQVTLLPTSAILPGLPDGGVSGAPAGQPVTYALDKGQLLQFTQADDLSGTRIQATHPVGLWGSHLGMSIPENVLFLDAAHQQIPPVKALGSRYAAVSYRTRRSDGIEEAAPWRIMGMVGGTVLTYDPPLVGAPASLDVGQVVEFSAIVPFSASSVPFVVSSQDAAHPFYLAAHMTSCAGVEGYDPHDPNGVCHGDPETVNVIPPEQFLSSYMFFTDTTYGDTNLVLVRGPASDGSYKDVQLDCLGGTPVAGWAAIGGSVLQYARVDVQLGGAPVGSCDNGVHTITSESPFGLTVWGWDAAVSYAYPAGASVKPINTVAVPIAQ